ncbi:CPBP family intramembrane metalloprotease [Bacillus luteus]|uniref:CPBP family intramembrane metalloprotease n=2 Tax=Alkalicoccus luteus TaxID=1237094 RepID=A0A969PRE2_9BACI|nr:CPBP family intramembrane glutamic endopeptidase [Alkalicoccus luteus]NJP38160.1 CPBP family intramembrane metalloprotease [Alkalicoccus luteus]
MLDQLTDKELYANLYATQGFMLAAALAGAFFLTGSIFTPFINISWHTSAILAGIAFAAAVILLEILFYKTLPPRWFDDGGVNERIFRHMHPVHIAVVSLIVAVCEEVLFRGVIQEQFGLIAASLLFALIHVRYLKNIFLFSFVVIMSVGLGLLYEWTGTLLSVILAHFLIDFILGLLIRYKVLS